MPSATRRRFMHFAGAALATPFVSHGAAAQAWPSKPIRVIVPFSAGSTTDIVGRTVVERVGAQLGHTFVVENRGGAGGTIGATAVSLAEPDGHTLLVHSSGISAAPAIYPNIRFDPAGDFSGIGLFGSVPNVMIISPKKRIKTPKELVEAAKKGSVTFASAGAGSASHWAAERFRIAAGMTATHVPFRGGPEGITEVMTGRVDFMCVGVSSSIALIRDGSLLPLAVSTRTRSFALPEVPTTLEAGFPDSDYTFWNGLLAPAKTPRPIVERLHEEVRRAMASAAVKEKFGPQGIEPMDLTPAEFDATIRAEIAANFALVKAAGLKFN